LNLITALLAKKREVYSSASLICEASKTLTKQGCFMKAHASQNDVFKRGSATDRWTEVNCKNASFSRLTLYCYLSSGCIHNFLGEVKPYATALYVLVEPSIHRKDLAKQKKEPHGGGEPWQGCVAANIK